MQYILKVLTFAIKKLTLRDWAPIRKLSDRGGGALRRPPSISETIIDRVKKNSMFYISYNSLSCLQKKMTEKKLKVNTLREKLA